MYLIQLNVVGPEYKTFGVEKRADSVLNGFLFKSGSKNQNSPTKHKLKGLTFEFMLRLKKFISSSALRWTNNKSD